jgi:hypothetical protein
MVNSCFQKKKKKNPDRPAAIHHGAATWASLYAHPHPTERSSAWLAAASSSSSSSAMESPIVLMLHPFNAYLEQELDRRCRLIRFWESPPESRDEFLRAHAASIRADADLIDALPALEIVASFSVGIDRVDLAKCRERGIRVTNTPDVLTDDVADLAVGLAFAVLRRPTGTSTPDSGRPRATTLLPLGSVFSPFLTPHCLLIC